MAFILYFRREKEYVSPLICFLRMKKYTIFLFLLTLFTACGTAEQAERRGDAALALGEYAEAAGQYRIAYQRTLSKDKANRGRRAYLMANAYRRYGNYARSLANYLIAERYNNNDTLINFRIAELHRIMGNYREAQKSYEKQLALTPFDELTLQGLRATHAAAQEKIENGYTAQLAPILNGGRSDYSPAFLGTEAEQLYFTTTRRQVKGNEPSGITGIMPGDIWFMKKDEKGKWKQPATAEGGVNTEFDEGACSFSFDGKTMFLTVCRTDPQYGRMAEIWTSQRSDATWSKPQQLKITNDTLSSYAHPAISPNGRWLYFTSDLPGGYGGTDIWRASLMPSGVAFIENLGKDVNTAGNEAFPTFRADGELFYSSDGKGGLGGLDIFQAHLDTASQSWQVYPLPSPINSSGDDFGLAFEGNRMRGYFASNRATGGRGWDKIYSFTFPSTTATVKGWVYEQDGYELPAAQVHMVGTDGTNQKVSVLSDGSFERPVRPGVSYIFLASNVGYLNMRAMLPADSTKDGNLQHVLQFPLASMTAPVIVRNVFYEFDKATLTARSTEALDRLVALLNENPHITIELSAHTDSRGNDAYNLQLSQRRAESVVCYLTQHGIKADRLTPKGYGRLHPIVVSKKLAETYPFLHVKDTLNATFIAKLPLEQQEICHGLNRRTAFRVLRTTYGIFDKDGKLKPNALPTPKQGEAGKTPEGETESYPL